MEGLDVLKGKLVFYWTGTCSNSCLWHQLHSLRYLKFGAFSSHIHFSFIILNDSTSSRLLLSLCCLFIFIRWPHFLNSQREQKSFWFSVFLTTVPPPRANFLASLPLFLPHFGIRGKYISSVQRRHFYWSSASQRLLLPQSILHYLFSSLSYVSSLFHCLLFHASGPHPGITCLSPQGAWQCLETSLVVTMRGYCSGSQSECYRLPAHQGHGCS